MTHQVKMKVGDIPLLKGCTYDVVQFEDDYVQVRDGSNTVWTLAENCIIKIGDGPPAGPPIPAFWVGEPPAPPLVAPEAVAIPVGMKNDTGKNRMGLFMSGCPTAIRSVSDVITFGANKYEPNNWQKVDADRFWDALYRHLNEYHQGEADDPESGMAHLAHAATNIMFILEKYNNPK